MRLIDANAVSELLWSEYHEQKQRADYQAGLCHAMMTISQAKTINPKRFLEENKQEPPKERENR